MSLLKKWWFWLGLVLLLAAAGAGYRYWSQKNEPPQFRTAKIEKGAISSSVSASGTLSPVVSVQVGSQVSGQLRDILVDFNSEVKKDQLIARIDPETFEYKVRQAEADLNAARAQVQTQQATIAAQKAQVSQVQVTLADAKRDLERKQMLVEKNFISGAERDKAQATYNALIEQVKAAQAQVLVAEANAANAAAVVQQRQAFLAQAKIDLARTAIRAPVNGIVIKRSVERGQTVAASLQAPELFIIAENLTEMRVDTAVDESEIGRVRNGQKATYTVDAFPGRTFEGTVTQIRKAAQNVSNVVTYTVEVAAPNPGRELLPGMTANVRIMTDARRDVLKVPNAALRFRMPGAGGGAGAAKADGAPAAAQAGGGGGGQLAALRERLEKELQPTPDQKTKLDGIFAGMHEKFAAMRDAAPAERQKILERNRSDMRAQISEILNPEQKKKYAEIVAEQSSRSGGSGGNYGRGRIYLLDEKGQPKEVQVRVGLSDGTMTEVVATELKEGSEVIVGSNQSPSQSPNAPARPPTAAPGPRLF